MIQPHVKESVYTSIFASAIGLVASFMGGLEPVMA
jgi:hypothetical protein